MGVVVGVVVAALGVWQVIVPRSFAFLRDARRWPWLITRDGGPNGFYLLLLRAQGVVFVLLGAAIAVVPLLTRS